MRYRLYVDEVGNPDMRASTNPNQRFLSLTGLIIEQDYANDVLAPRLEALKRQFFGSHADEPVILHRKELVNRRHPFDALRDPAIEAAFNVRLLELVQSVEFRVITVVMDKKEVGQLDAESSQDPYHRCLERIIDRYVLMVETRGFDRGCACRITRRS